MHTLLVLFPHQPPRGGRVAIKAIRLRSKENMRDLLYKNLTLSAKGRKIITSSEITDKEGIHSVVRRHFSCLVKPVQNEEVSKPQPYFFVLKERNLKAKREHFFCKIKGSLLAVNEGKLLLILFVHTLSVELTALPKLSPQTS